MTKISETKVPIVALVGNPNSGKSSVFNLLTGMRQKTGNYPGVTVDKKTGFFFLEDQTKISVLDLPGTYSLYPNSQDERIVLNILSNPRNASFPDAIIYVSDITQLNRQLLLLSQIIDLKIPTVLALTMTDVAAAESNSWDVSVLSSRFLIPVIPMNGRTGEGLDELKSSLKSILDSSPDSTRQLFYEMTALEKKLSADLSSVFNLKNAYTALLWAHHFKKLGFIKEQEKVTIESLVEKYQFKDLHGQISETMQRYNNLQPLVQKTIQFTGISKPTHSDKIDKVATHFFWGPILFISLMTLIFQSIFTWAGYPMGWIESGISLLSGAIKSGLGEGWFTDLLTDGVLAGLSGVLVFIPQIAILFLLITLLEEIGYMARAVYIFDKLMQRFGLNGRSMVSLISAGACAIPAIMSTRTIGNWKERLITIMVTPLISCSARIPVYILLITFCVSPVMILGLVSLQTITFLGLYVLSTLVTLAVAFIFHKVLKSDEQTFLALELPDYRMPHWRNVFLIVFEKVRSFVTEAGKIIMFVSILLWGLSRFGPPGTVRQATDAAEKEAVSMQLSPQEKETHIASRKLEASFAGLFGKAIEPAIIPLGYDWKIGIALITSFAAREVFVGTMATIYSLNDSNDTRTLQQKMRADINPDTGKPVFTYATSISLLIFYVFAMQCMSTLAVVRRETKSWKWPLIQLAFMSTLAYGASWIVYQLLK